MGNKKSYTQVLIEIEGRLGAIETMTQYQENHLRNIDQHLEKLNTRTGDNEVNIAKNSNSINWMRWIGAGLFTVLGAAVAIALKVFGVF